jgi:hypothetical protein
MPTYELSKAETALLLSPPARRIIAGDPLVPRLARAGGDFELVFASPPIAATGANKTKPGVRLVDAARKREPITAGWQHF